MKPKIISKKPVAETDFLNLMVTSFQNKKGDVGSWSFAERPKQRAAVIIYALVDANTDNPKLVITKEFRVPIENYEHGMPAGLIDAGEGIMETAKRELEEETGLKVVKEIRRHSPKVYNSAGALNEGCYLCFVEADGTPSTDKNEDDEDISVMVLDRKEAEELMKSGYDDDNNFGAKAWLVLQRFVDHGDI